MFLQYPKWYKRYGVRNLSHILRPKIFDISTIEFPISTAIHFVNLDDTPTVPTRDIGYLSNLPKEVLVRSIITYPTNRELEGKFVELPGHPNSLIKDMAETERTFYFLKNNQVLTKPEKVPYIYNYGSLNSKYRYVLKPLTNMWKYRNGIKTVLSNIPNNKHNMLVINLPLDILPRLKVIKFLQINSVTKIRAIPSYKEFNFLEIFKLFIQDEHDKSLFSTIPVETMKNIDILFVAGVRCSIINMYDMLSTIKDLNLDSKLNKKFSYDKANKVWYRYLYNIISTIPLEDDPDTADLELEAKSETDTDTKEDIKQIKEVKKPIYNNSLTSDIKKEESSKNKPNPELQDDADDDSTIIGKFLDKYKELKDMSKNNKNNIDKIEDDEYDNLEDEMLEEITKDIDIEEDLSDTSSTVDTGIDTETKLAKLSAKYNKKESSTYKDIENIEDVLEDNDLFNKNLVKAEELYNNKGIPKSKYENMIKTTQESLNSINPITKRKIKEDLDISKDDYTLTEEEVIINNTPMIFNNKSNKNVIKTFKKKYITTQYHKDVVRSIFALTNNAMTIKDYEVNIKSDIIGDKEEHTFNVTTFDGKTTKVSLILPKIKEDGSYTLNGNNYILRSQISDLPIIKIDNNKVELNSYYGKLFIVKASTTANDASKSILKSLVTDENVKHLQSGVNNLVDKKLPNLYYQIGRYIKSFHYNKYIFTFNYPSRYEILGKLDKTYIDKLENKFLEDNVVLVGKINNNPIVMNFDNKIFEYKDNSYIELDDIFDILNIDTTKLPIEFTSVKIVGNNIPLGLLISYYIGFDNLLKILKVKYEVVDRNTRVSLNKDQYVIKFNNTKLIITKDNGQADLLLGSFRKYESILKDLDIDILNNKNTFQIVLSRLQLTPSALTEIDLLENMFIDPLTYTTLKELKQPTSFKGLLLKANEMLINDYYTNPDDINKSRIKGYERIPGFIYLKLSQALKKYENANRFGKAKFGLSSYDVIDALIEDSANVSIDNNNPVAYIKQTEDTTKLGEGGRSKLTMSANTRVLNSSEIGIISEASKDSGDVGITAFLTANPKLTNTKGMVTTLEEEDDWSSIVSTSAMISPFGLTDDAKRLNKIDLYKVL